MNIIANNVALARWFFCCAAHTTHKQAQLWRIQDVAPCATQYELHAKRSKCCAAQCFANQRIQAKHIVLGFSERSTAALAVVNSGTVGRTLVFSPNVVVDALRTLSVVGRSKRHAFPKWLALVHKRERAAVSSIIGLHLQHICCYCGNIRYLFLHAQDLHCSLPCERADSILVCQTEPASHREHRAVNGQRRATSDRSASAKHLGE